MFSRSEWAIRLLRLSRLSAPDSAAAAVSPGLVMVQIDGLSMTQFNRAVHKGHAPFLKDLMLKERYVLHSLYSGLPSNTPAVQAELMYGVKTCVPAFSYVPQSLGRPIKMFDSSFVEQFEPTLKQKGEGLLTGGSSYSNIYTGGAQEAHFCFGQMGWGGIWHAINPLVFPFLVLLYIDIFFRTFVLFLIEIALALGEFFRGVLQGRVFWKELEMIWLRSLVCVLLREYIVAGACMDIMRGLPVIHLNFLGYDEQAHCRGPSSAYAHWSMRGIDDCIRRIHDVIRQSPCREYDLWVYSDHGQEKTTPYLVKYGKTAEQAIQELFECPMPIQPQRLRPGQATRVRAELLNSKKKSGPPDAPIQASDVTVTAMGPLGHIYVKNPLDQARVEFYARKLVDDVKIPLVVTRAPGDKVQAWTPRGVFALPQQAKDVFGQDHPFLEEIKEDLLCVCLHPDAGQFVIAGWSEGQEAVSFPVEYGAHASMGKEETHAFTLMPIDAPLARREKTYLRPLDLREAALRFLNKESAGVFASPEAPASKSLRIMSYNVHGCLGMDGTISSERIARVIARYNPDIISLQELDAGRGRSGGVDQSERIARKLEMHYHFHPAFRWKDEQYGNAILSRYPMALIKMGTLPKLSEKRRYEPRGAIWAAVEFEGRHIQVFNTHLSLWPQERLLQVNALLGDQWIGHRDCIGPVVLCGDFNSLPGSPAYRKICHRLKDSQACLSGHEPSRTWFGRYPLSQIDYIFLGEDFRVSAITVPRTRLEKTASDHLPLIADLDLDYPDIEINQYQHRRGL